MARDFAWVLNFDAEDELAAASPAASAYTPPRAALARFEALAAEVAALLGPNDHLLVPRAPGRDTRPPLDPSRRRALLGRAWCPTPRALRAFLEAGVEVPKAPPLDVLRHVNHRRFAAELGQTLPGARFVDTMDELIEAIAAPSPTGHWLLKRPFGFTGRGRRKVRSGSLEEAARPFALASLAPRRHGRASDLRAGGLQVEPWVDRAGDAAIHGFISASGEITLGEPTVQRLSPSGAWVGSARAAPFDLSDGELRDLEEAAGETARALYAAGYFGPFGIDAFRYRDAQGAVHFNPRCEINARYSMGWATGMGDRRPDLDEA
jgi:hypothetical protein